MRRLNFFCHCNGRFGVRNWHSARLNQGPGGWAGRLETEGREGGWITCGVDRNSVAVPTPNKGISYRILAFFRVVICPPALPCTPLYCPPLPPLPLPPPPPPLTLAKLAELPPFECCECCECCDCDVCGNG